MLMLSQSLRLKMTQFGKSKQKPMFFLESFMCLFFFYDNNNNNNNNWNGTQWSAYCCQTAEGTGEKEEREHLIQFISILFIRHQIITDVISGNFKYTAGRDRTL